MRYRSLLNRQLIVFAEGILKLGGSCRDRTYDLRRVKALRYRCAKEPKLFTSSDICSATESDQLFSSILSGAFCAYRAQDRSHNSQRQSQSTREHLEEETTIRVDQQQP